MKAKWHHTTSHQIKIKYKRSENDFWEGEEEEEENDLFPFFFSFFFLPSSFLSPPARACPTLQDLNYMMQLEKAVSLRSYLCWRTFQESTLSVTQTTAGLRFTPLPMEAMLKLSNCFWDILTSTSIPRIKMGKLPFRCVVSVAMRT